MDKIVEIRNGELNFSWEEGDMALFNNTLTKKDLVYLIKQYYDYHMDEESYYADVDLRNHSYYSSASSMDSEEVYNFINPHYVGSNGDGLNISYFCHSRTATFEGLVEYMTEIINTVLVSYAEALTKMKLKFSYHKTTFINGYSSCPKVEKIVRLVTFEIDDNENVIVVDNIQEIDTVKLNAEELTSNTRLRCLDVSTIEGTKGYVKALKEALNFPGSGASIEYKGKEEATLAQLVYDALDEDNTEKESEKIEGFSINTFRDILTNGYDNTLLVGYKEIIKRFNEVKSYIVEQHSI